MTKLEIHAVHGCNLSCPSCSHFSGDQRGIVTTEQAIDWCGPWVGKLRPKEFRILGGEPTLHPDISGFIAAMGELWKCPLKLVTNGARLSEIDRTVLQKYDVLVNLSLHGQNIESAIYYLETYNLKHKVTNSKDKWTKRYHGAGNEIRPYTDDNPRQSWQNCQCKFCRQIYDGKLWKCPTITYLNLQNRLLGPLHASYDQYLRYVALSPNCTEEELRKFLSKEEEAICNMCPSTPDPYANQPVIRNSRQLPIA